MKKYDEIEAFFVKNFYDILLRNGCIFKVYSLSVQHELHIS